MEKLPPGKRRKRQKNELEVFTRLTSKDKEVPSVTSVGDEISRGI